jgi:hypothetical protein
MALPIARGSPLLQKQNESFKYDPTTGLIHSWDYKGISQAYAIMAQQDYARAGIPCVLTLHQGDTATLEIDDPTFQYTLDTWEVADNEESPDAWQNPKVEQVIYDIASGYAALSDGSALTFGEVMAAIRQALANDQPSDGDGGAFQDGALLPFYGTSIQRIYDDYQAGGTEFRRAQYVLRHKTNAPRIWTTNVADIGVEQIYSTSQLLTEASDASLWIYPLPPRLAYKIANLPSPIPRANYMWGWLKSGTTESTAANNRIDLTTEYCLYQWSLDKYDAF